MHMYTHRYIMFVVCSFFAINGSEPSYSFYCTTLSGLIDTNMAVDLRPGTVYTQGSWCLLEL